MFLIFDQGPRRGEVVPISGDGIVVGRDADADLRLDDDQVSRRHARFEVRGGGVEVRDLGSTNGTFVDGERLGGPRRLQGGEIVRIGGAVLTYSLSAAEAPGTGTVLVTSATRANAAPPPVAAPRPAAGRVTAASLATLAPPPTVKSRKALVTVAGAAISAAVVVALAVITEAF